MFRRQLKTINIKRIHRQIMRVCRYSQVGKSGGGGDVGVAVGMIVKL